MKKNINLLVASFCLVLAFALTACNSKEEQLGNRLKGTWAISKLDRSVDGTAQTLSVSTGKFVFEDDDEEGHGNGEEHHKGSCEHHHEGEDADDKGRYELNLTVSEKAATTHQANEFSWSNTGSQVKLTWNAEALPYPGTQTTFQVVKNEERHVELTCTYTNAEGHTIMEHYYLDRI